MVKPELDSMTICDAGVGGKVGDVSPLMFEVFGKITRMLVN